MQYFVKICEFVIFGLTIKICVFPILGLAHLRICGFAIAEGTQEFADLQFFLDFKKSLLAHLCSTVKESHVYSVTYITLRGISDSLTYGLINYSLYR